MIIFYFFQAVLSLHNMGVATTPRAVGMMVRRGGWKVGMQQVNGQDGHPQTHASTRSQARMHARTKVRLKVINPVGYQFQHVHYRPRTNIVAGYARVTSCYYSTVADGWQRISDK